MAGTDFELTVWRALASISYGETLSYSGLGLRAGFSASAARAIANACGANPLPIVVPCHRVLRSDGSIGGYSAAGGVELKRALLLLEEVQA